MDGNMSERIKEMDAQSKAYALRTLEVKKEIADAEKEIQFYCMVCGADPDAFLSLDMNRIKSVINDLPDDDNKLQLVQSALKFCEGHRAADKLRNEVLAFQCDVQAVSAESRRNVIENYGAGMAEFIEALAHLTGSKSVEEIAREGCV